MRQMLMSPRSAIEAPLMQLESKQLRTHHLYPAVIYGSSKGVLMKYTWIAFTFSSEESFVDRKVYLYTERTLGC